MDAIKSITITREVRRVEEQTIPTEVQGGLRYAITFTADVNNEKVVAIFDSIFWAREFVRQAYSSSRFRIVNIETGEELSHR